MSRPGEAEPLQKTRGPWTKRRGRRSATSAWAVDLLLLHSTVVAEHTDAPDPADPGGALARAITRAPARDYPRLHAARADLLSGSPKGRFTWAVDVIVGGVLQTPVRPEGADRRRWSRGAVCGRLSGGA